MKKYKLSWEMVGPTKLRKYSNADPMYYSHTTQTVPNSQIPDEDWHRVEKVVDNISEIEDQYKTLKSWADEDRDFVRNVKLEVAEVGEPKWERYEN